MRRAVSHKTKQEALDAVGALIPFTFWRQAVETPVSGYYFGFFLSVVAGALFASPTICLWAQRRRPNQTIVCDNKPDVSVNLWILVPAWIIAAVVTVLVAYKGGSGIRDAVADPLAPWWHHIWVILLANYAGWAGFCIWRALFNFTAELLRCPTPISAAPIAAPVAVPVTVSQTIPVAPPAVLQNGVTRP